MMVGQWRLVETPAQMCRKQTAQRRTKSAKSATICGRRVCCVVLISCWKAYIAFRDCLLKRFEQTCVGFGSIGKMVLGFVGINELKLVKCKLNN